MKDFTKEKWIECLAMKEWERLGETGEVETMAEHFTEIRQEKL